MDTFQLVRDLVAQLDQITERNYPTYNKYAARAGALQAVLTTTLGRLTDEQKESWAMEQAAIHTIQMNAEVKA